MRLKNVRILIVDDSEDIRELIQYFLEKEGAETDLAEDARDGVDRALHTEFDLVLMDIQMPEMSGHEAVSALRSSGYTKPIVALTANALPNERQKCLSEGFDAYLTKPIEWPQLMRKTQELLMKHQFTAHR